MDHPTDWREIDKSVEGTNEKDKQLREDPQIVWEEFHDLVESVRKKREYLQKKHEELNSVYEKLVRENQKFERERNLIVEEIKIMKALMVEYRARYSPQTEGLEAYTKGLNELTDIMDESLQTMKKTDSNTDRVKQKMMALKRMNTTQTPELEIISQQTPRSFLVSKKVRIHKKKQIKTTLHHMMEIINKQERVRVKDLSNELGVDTGVILQWAKVMERRGMLNMSYSMRNGHILEKTSTAG